MSTATPVPTCTTRPEPGSPATESLRTIVVGLGNPLLTDDAVGLHVLNRVRPALSGRPGLELTENYWGGLRLMERLIGYHRAVIIDAQCSGAPPGTVSVLDADALPTRHGNSAHDADLRTALEFGRRAGAELPTPGNVRVVAIEAAEVNTFGEECTSAVAAGIPRAAEVVLTLLNEWR